MVVLDGLVPVYTTIDVGFPKDSVRMSDGRGALPLSHLSLRLSALAAVALNTGRSHRLGAQIF